MVKFNKTDEDIMPRVGDHSILPTDSKVSSERAQLVRECYTKQLDLQRIEELINHSRSSNRAAFVSLFNQLPVALQETASRHAAYLPALLQTLQSEFAGMTDAIIALDGKIDHTNKTVSRVLDVCTTAASSATANASETADGFRRVNESLKQLTDEFKALRSGNTAVPKQRTGVHNGARGVTTPWCHYGANCTHYGTGACRFRHRQSHAITRHCKYGDTCRRRFTGCKYDHGPVVTPQQTEDSRLASPADQIPRHP